MDADSCPQKPEPSSELDLLKQQLEIDWKLPGYDYKVERVCREVARIFASRELQQRLAEKGRTIC
uniref:Uncharacterized protein n=1 Tax=Cyanothece sp. (strain PCC 7425 / ATCC 29141) TaxID=395961 RepID=B8HSE2_CYAP4